MQKAKIKARDTPNGITLYVTTSKKIENFTIKLINVKGDIQAKCDGTAIGAGNVTPKDNVCIFFYTSAQKHIVS